MRKGNCIIIVNSEGKYLMQFRDSKPGIQFPLMWEFFGGSSEGDEAALEGTIRELNEELEIKVSEDELEEVAMHTMNGIDEYLYRLKRPLAWGEFIVKEGAGAAFLSKEELLKLPMSERAQFFVRTHM